MRILHTSDWHIGRTLYGNKRYEEFAAFFDWLAKTIDERGIEALLVAGDIFDTGTPSNRAQELYYRFLVRVAASRCRHIVLVAGNHDSPSFLDAPQALLKAIRIHVVGSMRANPEEEVLELDDARGRTRLIVCAVPYLRDRDIRTTEAGESFDEKEQKLLEGIRAHYAAVAREALHIREKLGSDIPIAALGHLFATGAQTVEGDGVRELYIGSLAHVSPAIFPPCFDYLALGHLHVPQKVGGSETMRYSGSPLPMGFGEAHQQKIVCQVDFCDRKATVTPLAVPVFQKLERISGDRDAIVKRLRELEAKKERVWLEIVSTGVPVTGDLREQLETHIAGSALEILRIRNGAIPQYALNAMDEGESLEELAVDEVFERCLGAHDIPEEQRPELRRLYREVRVSLDEDDLQAQ